MEGFRLHTAPPSFPTRDRGVLTTHLSPRVRMLEELEKLALELGRYREQW